MALAKAGVEAAASFGVQVTVVLPGPVRTDFVGRSLDPVPRLPEYTATVGQFEEFLNKINGPSPATPRRRRRPSWPSQGGEGAAHAVELKAWENICLPTDFLADA